MARKRKGEKIDGWLIIDKPEGITSADVVRVVKRNLKPQKIGHAGTLDPLATGVLPIGMGEATKTMPYIVDQSKDYEFSVKWGEATSTDDREGQVTATSSVIPTDAEILEILPEFIGKITQTPPVFSAIKIDGKRAYERARAGEEVEMPSREVDVEDLKLLESSAKEGVSSFFVRCGKGTYVRALGRDMALKLGTVGHIVTLRRTRVGPFSQDSAILLDLLNNMSHIPPACGTILPVMTALDDILALAITAEELELIRQGQPILHTAGANGPIVLTHNDQLIAIANVIDGQIHPKRVFNL